MEQYPDLQALALFARVVEAGSFAKVTRDAGIPKASLSRKISQLEQFYGAQLIVRSTRHLQLTEIGRDIFEKSHSILSLLEETKTTVSKIKDKPHGLLRISAGVEYGVSIISPIVNSYLKKFPDVNIELDLTGRRVDLIYEGFDLGVRIGPLEDSSLSARKIGSFRYGLVASQPFVNANKPINLANLSNLPTLAFTRGRNKNTWELVNTLEDKKISIKPRLFSNNYWTLLNAVHAHIGVAFVPTFLVSEYLKKKTLVQLLPNWSSEEIPIHLIYPPQKYLTSKLRSFIDFVVDVLDKNK